MRIGTIFIIICMALIAASIGAALHFAAGIAASEAAYISLAVLFALMTCEVVASRNRDRSEISERFEELSRASSDIAREVGVLGRRVAALESASSADLKSITAPFAREIGELADLVEDLAESVAVHDALISTPPPAAAAPAAAPAQDAVAGKAAAAPAAVPGPFAGKKDEEVAAIIREAIADDRIDLYLQPIVTLPQRKVRYYEALSRLRLADGKIIDAKDFIGAARKAGLVPVIDQRLVLRCVQIVRRLAAKNREVSLFLNIAPETLASGALFAEILGYLDANRALAPSLVLELSHEVFRKLAPAQQINLAQLAERGFMLSLDRVEDFRLDPRTLAERGVRFVKVPGELMLSRSSEAGSQIHPADLADLLARFGIDLVAERIESEAIVVDLLDYDVRLGQGFLFSVPRPVRAEILQAEHAERRPPAANREMPPAPTGGLRDIAKVVRKTG
ncbi:MAG TPA: EAL domain-containing protein [Xanthobacteraceae bacterium]|nr:EAL domain-containing protein [Xanthobacteraceae bacterium]